MSLLGRNTVGCLLQTIARGCKNPKQPQHSKRSQIGLYAGRDIGWVAVVVSIEERRRLHVNRWEIASLAK